jgi:hypothetical protein
MTLVVRHNMQKMLKIEYGDVIQHQAKIHLDHGCVVIANRRCTHHQ